MPNINNFFEKIFRWIRRKKIKSTGSGKSESEINAQLKLEQDRLAHEADVKKAKIAAKAATKQAKIANKKPGFFARIHERKVARDKQKHDRELVFLKLSPANKAVELEKRQKKTVTNRYIAISCLALLLIGYALWPWFTGKETETTQAESTPCVSNLHKCRKLSVPVTGTSYEENPAFDYTYYVDQTVKLVPLKNIPGTKTPIFTIFLVKGTDPNGSVGFVQVFPDGRRHNIKYLPNYYDWKIIPSSDETVIRIDSIYVGKRA